MQVMMVAGYDLNRFRKWKEGRKKYGQDEFVGNPIDELYQEMLDAGNYVEEIARQGMLPADTCNNIDNLIRRAVEEIALGLEILDAERRES